GARAIGAGVVPLGVSLDVGVGGRELEGEVYRDLDAVVVGSADEAVEVVDVAELRVDRVVPALGAADRPRAADVAGLGDGGIVPPLAERAPDRVDGRGVEDVEPHAGDVGEAGLDVAGGA